MAIKKIKLSNFKSFDDLEIELGDFNVLIGANASGKSNFIQIFKFIRDITNHGLDNAISMQGGVEYLRNISIGSSKEFSLEVVFDREFRFEFARGNEKYLIGIEPYEVIYKFTIRFGKKGQEFEISEDELTQKCKFARLEEPSLREKEFLGQGEFIVSNVNGKVKLDLNTPEVVPIKLDDMFPPILTEENFSPKTLLIDTPFFFISPLKKLLFGDISIYDFDPKLPKRAIPISGKAELEEDGSNLALVLKNVIGDKNKKRKFSNLIKDLLPFVEDVDTAKFADKSLLFNLQESYFKNQYLPASLLSDGTINITALIIALYFEEKSLTIIEEPERNIHPYLISRVMDMMKEASEKKQVVVTTHNPEVVKHAGLENILLVSRGKDGFSTIFKPIEKERVKIFLENDMGIEELYAQNLLGL